MDTAKNDRADALLQRQTVLAQFGELAVRSNELDQILQEACRLVGDILGTDLAKVLELQSDGITVLVRAGIGWKPGVVGKLRIKATDGSSEKYAMQLGKSVVSPDIDIETRFAYDGFLKDNGVKALVNVPIIGANHKPPYGLLEVDSRTPRNFTEGDISFLTAFANLLAAAVERLRAQHALHDLNAKLATRVADRTRALESEQRDREAVEDKLRQSLKMEAVGQLTGGIAHDFNNMLAGIMGNLEMLRMRMAQGRTEDIGRYAEGALTMVHRAAALTHRLLAFSRRQKPSPKPTDVNQLVRSMEDLIRQTLSPNIFVEMALADNLWTAFCDANQLENALLNLAINSRDAMPDGGRLTVETANSTLDRDDAASQPELAPGQYVRICVSDTGRGMTPEVLARAIDPFFTTKPSDQGTGLGLSMIYGFVKQSKGHLRLYSEPSTGTTVHLFLPRHNGTEQENKPAQDSIGAAHSSHPLTILLVEDEDAIRNVSAEVLRDLGYHVITAADAAEALQTLESSCQVDLLVTDIGLPREMNGRRLADTARVSRPSLKVLFVTGFAENTAARTELLEAGMQLMTKPFSMLAFAGKVQGMIQDSGAALPP